MPIPTDTIDKLEQTWRALSALGARLDEAQWKLPSDNPGWTVQDNLSHLVGTERMLQGLPAAEVAIEPGPHVKNPIGAANEREVEARRSSTGADVLAEWDALVELRLTTLRSADEAYFEQPAMTPTGPGTLADFLHIRVLDCWAHEQDIRRAVGIAGGLDVPSAAHTVDRLIRTLPIVIGKRAGTPEGGAVVVDITGPVARHLVYEIHDGRAAQVEAPSAAPLATITLDTETFAVLALGRRDAASMSQRITVTGDAALGRRVVDQLSMMI